MTAIVGIDPGGANTGIVVRWREVLAGHVLVRRADNPDLYRELLLAEVDYAWHRAETAYPWSTPLVAVESVHAPNPHVRMTNVDGILATAEIVGAIRERCARRGYRLIMVPPGKHGSAILGSYPRKLVGPRDTGGGKLRHCRSAWDIAYLGGQLAVRDPSAVTVPSVESPVMAEQDTEKKTTPEDVDRVVRRVNLARPLLDAKVVEVVKAAHASGYTPREIIDGSPLSRQRVYQILRPEDSSE